MTIRTLVVCGGVLLGVAAAPCGRAEVSAAVPAPTAPAESQADLDYKALWALQSEPPSNPNLLKENPREFFIWQGTQMQRFSAAAVAFAEKYPHDPRRWEAIVQSSYTRPMYITGFAPGFDTHPSWGGLIEDHAKVAAFKAAQAKRLAAVLASKDATPRQRIGAHGALITEALASFGENKTPENKAAYLAAVDDFIKETPAAITMVAKQHIGFLQYNGTKEELAAFMTKLESSDDPAVKQMVAESRGDYKRFAGVADLKFTAADGREVDLAKLRGKVVLVDFWATWCGPCVAEIPNVVANYNKYHDKGFEAVGISLENPGAKPGDTPAKADERLAAAKQKMLDFTQANHMPWPQYFDGKWWKNDIAKRFNIEAIPAMVLIDPQGKVVSIEARGPQLEVELKRLLKL